MSIESRKHQYGTVFDHWQIKDNALGEGSGGKSAVFQLVHTSSPGVKSALKVISLIEERGNIETISAARRADYEAAKKVCKDNAEQEVLLMNNLQGNTNIVDYLDHTFVEWSDDSGFGCDMLIRMELLTDLRSEIQSNMNFSEADVLKIGRDVCQALILCHSKNILHRDIKPENIFKNKDGNYKLGDFGVSRIMSSVPMSMASTSIGTPEYAAPEQFSGMHDLRIDIYSLGLVLYELCNGKKLPFASSSYITQQEVQMRQLGTPIPAPTQASEKLSQVILKACAFNAADRYQTAQELFDDLDAVTKGRPLSAANKQPCYATMPAQSVTPRNYATMPAGAVNQNMGQKPTPKTTPVTEKKATQQQGKPTPKKSTKGKWILISVLAGIFAVAILAAVLFFKWYNSPEQKALRAMDAGNYDSVLSILDEDSDVDENAKLIDAALNQITNIRNNFISGSITYEEAKDALSDISLMHLDGIADDIAETTALIESLHISGEYYNAAEEFFANGQYDTAIENYRLVNEADDNYENAQKKLSEATDLYRNAVLNKAQEQVATGNYEDAIETLLNALVTLPEDTQIRKKLSDYEGEHYEEVKSTALTEAETLAASGDYISAIDVLANAQQCCENDADLVAKATEYEDAYVSEILKQVNACLEENKISEAKEVLQKATKDLPNNNAIKERIEELNKYKTTPLNSLNPINGGFSWDKGTPGDPQGNNYSTSQNYAIVHHDYAWDESFSAEYRVDYAYSTFQFSVSPYSDMKEGANSYVQIFVNDVLRYTTPTINQKSGRVDVPLIDISDAEYIKIVVNTGGHGCIMLSDVLLNTIPDFTSEIDKTKTPITGLSMMNGNVSWDNERPRDMYNSDYTQKNNYSIIHHDYSWDESFYAEYYLAGKYETISLDMAPLDDMRSSSSACVKVYADDVLRYTSPAITQKTQPFNSGEINLAGAQYVKIVLELNGYGCIIISDVILTNKV